VKLIAFRHKFPEYDDLSDAEALVIISELFSAPESDSRLPEAMMALADGFKSLEKALSKPPKEKEEKKTDYSHLLMALGQQMAKIETAISSREYPSIEIPEVKIPEIKQIKSLKVKRNDLGYITEILPVY